LPSHRALNLASPHPHTGGPSTNASNFSYLIDALSSHQPAVQPGKRHSAAVGFQPRRSRAHQLHQGASLQSYLAQKAEAHAVKQEAAITAALNAKSALAVDSFPNLDAVVFNDESDELKLSPAELDRSTADAVFTVSDITQRLAAIEELLRNPPAAQQHSSHRGQQHAGGEPNFLPRPPRKAHRIDAIIEKALDCATADRERGRNSTGVRAWFAFCQDVMGTSPERAIDPNEPLWVRLEEEWLAMRFICALVEQRGILPETAAKYFSQVQGWHAREFGVKLAGGLKLERLPSMVKGLRRMTPRGPKPIRRGISPQQLGRATQTCLSTTSPLHANVRAACSTALQGLLRSAEYCGTLNSETLLRGDIKKLDDEQLVLMMHPCKNMRHIAGKSCPLVIGAGGSYVDAVADIRRLIAIDPAPDDAPLFRDPSTNKPLSYQFMLETTRALVGSIGLTPSEYGTHSFRIGGATALFAAGATDTVIRTMGRWSSDIHRLYVRACYEQCIDWTRRCGSANASSIAADFDEVDDY
jgi:hypothetical protein